MANPAADYPTALHTNTDISAFTASKLGSTSPTHTAVEGKQEEEVKAVQTKVGTGSSTPSAGKVLRATGTGTSGWAAADLTTDVTGVLPIANGGTNGSDAATAFSNLKQAATSSATGVAELATSAEVTTGTDTGRVVTPEGLSHSTYGKEFIQIKVIDDATVLTTGDGKFHFFIPAELNGYNLVTAHAGVSTVSSSGTPTIQIANVTQAADMLSTRITIDANEKTSYTAATAPVIDTSNDDVATGDELRIDSDVAGTGAKGLAILLAFQLP